LFHDPALRRGEVHHRPDLIQEGRDIRVVKIDHHDHKVASTAGVFPGQAITVYRTSHLSKDGLKISYAIAIGVET
jgi:hypothetical protein